MNEKTSGETLNESRLSSPTSWDRNSDPECNKKDESGMPPVDGGPQAWLFLVACFMVEGIVWGFAQSFGVFQDYYRTDPTFEGSQAIANIGTCAMGAAYLLTPAVIAVVMAFPCIQRWASSVGFIFMALSLALASFSKNTTHLVLSQGIFYGISGCFAYTPSILFINTWFKERRGLAFGIVWSGSGLTGVIFPLILQELLDNYGWQTTLRICSVAVFLLAAPFMPFHRPRSQLSGWHFRDLDLSFHKNRTYILYQVGNIIQALGYFLPSIFLTSYARYLGQEGILASLSVTLFNVANIFGCILMGFLVDRFHVANVVSISVVGGVLSSFLLWGLSTHIATLYIFAMIYGSTSGSFSSTWAAMSNEVAKVHPAADVSMVFAFLEAGRGVGNVVSGPLSEALLSLKLWEGKAFGAYGSEYGLLVVFTGLSALVAGVPLYAKWLKML